MPENRTSVRNRTAEGFAAYKDGRFKEAEAAARAVLAADPRRPEAHFLVGLLAVERKDWRTGVAAFGSVTKLNPADRAAWAQLALLFQRVGHFDRADAALARALEDAPSDPETADLIGAVLTQFGRHREAAIWHRRAFEAEPHRADFAVNCASACVFLGQDAEAAAALDRFIEAEGVPQAEWLYSTLKRARSRSRADRLAARAGNARAAQAKAFLAYAAGKEYEDCELWQEAFAAFDEGARAKRSAITFDESAEISFFDALAAQFTASWLAKAKRGVHDPSPIFIVGQPRTGTTLVERIIASHSAVEAAGELQQFGLAIRRAGGFGGGAESVEGWSRVDPHAIGKAYLESAAPMRGANLRFIDKMPRNFLYVPLIAAALPHAKIIHLTRDPLDACFASFKQLFAEAYPHSYNQEEMARHFVRYTRLMDHWRKVLPGAFLEVSYEKLVADVEAEARRIIAYLELPWEDQCLRFHELDAPVATASAVQVREAAHGRSVGRALKYAEKLAPMRGILAAEGLLTPVVAGIKR
jgi:tetratricopeptide (TPR) repeat protein